MDRYLFVTLTVWISMLALLSGGEIDPFMDQTMFMIDWKGPLLTPLEGPADNVVLMTKDQEQYQCIVPHVRDRKHKDSAGTYDGPTAAEMMESLFQQTYCSYRLESYWTYELCHGKHLRQYHEVKDAGSAPRLQEYFLGLGRFNSEPSADSAIDEPPISHGQGTGGSNDDGGEKEAPHHIKDTNIKHRKVDGIDLPYYEVVMRDGTPCDLTQKQRLTHVLYVCQPDGHGEVYELKETATCEYEVMVLTAVLCAHPLFRPKNPPVNKISCHSMLGAPVKPHTLNTWEQESKRLTLQQDLIFGMPEDPVEAGEGSTEEERGMGDRKVPKILTSTSSPKTVPTAATSSTINKVTDKQVLRDLLTGDFCLQGGSGWWKHEVCLGRNARQFHKERTGETSVLLGNFNEALHLQWLVEHPHKKPKPVEQRKQLNYLYTGGDVCDITGKHRQVEVRLKCIVNTQSPHGVSLFLSEPATCEYVLVLESALLCDLMPQADENGLLKNINL